MKTSENILLRGLQENLFLWLTWDEIREQTKDKDPFTAFCLAYYLARDIEDLAGLMAKAIFWEKIEESDGGNNE